jgi:hypothetical protein
VGLWASALHLVSFHWRWHGLLALVFLRLQQVCRTEHCRRPWGLGRRLRVLRQDRWISCCGILHIQDGSRATDRFIHPVRIVQIAWVLQIATIIAVVISRLRSLTQILANKRRKLVQTPDSVSLGRHLRGGMSLVAIVPRQPDHRP